MTVCSTSPSMTSSSESVYLGPNRWEKGFLVLRGLPGTVVQVAPSTRGVRGIEIQPPLWPSCGLHSFDKWSTSSWRLGVPSVRKSLLSSSSRFSRGLNCTPQALSPARSSVGSLATEHSSLQPRVCPLFFPPCPVFHLNEIPGILHQRLSVNGFPGSKLSGTSQSPLPCHWF